MAVIWNLGYDFTNGGQHSGWGVLNNAFDAGAILPGATSTQFHLKDGQNLITFKGNFVVNGGVVQSGTITGFDAYYGNSTNHLIEASGHSISFSAFNQGARRVQDEQSVSAVRTHLRTAHDGERLQPSGLWRDHHRRLRRGSSTWQPRR
jgi:hypothetical protein